MHLSLKPDFEVSRQRYEAFWNGQIIDRPPVSLPFTKADPEPIPQRSYSSQEERWLDVAFRAEQIERQLENTVFYADALPTAWPNMGPEIFSAWCGCEYVFGPDTAWSYPCINDWKTDGPLAVFNPDHRLFKATVDFTETLLERSQDKFIVGLTDFHPGGDHLAALRDPQNLAMDMLENIDHVRAKLAESYQEFFRVYDIFFQLLQDNGMPFLTSWVPLLHSGRFYIPSNDFSCMISREMFDEHFLPGIAAECRFYERSIYHLDGPGALRHLDSLLAIKDLDAVQWVPGAGNEGFCRWMDVHKRIQDAGKSQQLVSVALHELQAVFDTLRPEGIWFSHIEGVSDKDTADRVLADIEAWTFGRLW